MASLNKPLTLTTLDSSSVSLNPSPSSSSSSFLIINFNHNSHLPSSLSHYLRQTMRNRVRTTFLLTFASLVLFACFSLHLYRDAISDPKYFFTFSKPNITINTIPTNSDYNYNYAIHEVPQPLSYHTRRVASLKDSISTVSILFPDWEVLVIVSPESPLPMTSLKDDYICFFQNNDTSQAKFAGVLPFTNRTTFKCVLPNTVRRLRPFFQPILMRILSEKPSSLLPKPELIRFSFLVYESLSTEDDVVLFVKGVNHRQGINRSPSEFRCVFGDVTKNNAVKTVVTSCVQEVFRCHHPNITTLGSGGYDTIKISLEIVGENLIAPSVAYYIPRRTVVHSQPKSQLCACTMVYNVGKFLKEWVTYHFKIGIDKFIIYDNDSYDDLKAVVNELNEEGYDITTMFWLWPKTQEAGFSHSTIYANNSCTWMMYIDVDEFIFSPSWNNESQPSNHTIKSILPKGAQTLPSSYGQIGQVLFRCNEFGPSNQSTHPIEGVTQGYTCRRKVGQRHKSIVLLDAVDHSLLNVVHHFQLRSDYRTKQLSVEDVVLNHYKYQAWPEFRTKFRRRVSAYVVDWKQMMNPNSKDRTPGLGFEPIEPEGWATKFCEVNDDRLKILTRKWFGSTASNGYNKMAWQ